MDPRGDPLTPSIESSASSIWHIMQRLLNKHSSTCPTSTQFKQFSASSKKCTVRFDSKEVFKTSRGIKTRT
eukprot:scaffold85449_cov65-Cyclotella_meneghiniana.AAC.8